MVIFPSAREAKEYLAARVEQEAQRQGVALNPIERDMLLFSDIDPAPPDAMQANYVFERDYDQAAYERKLTPVIQMARRRALDEGDDSEAQWQAAIDSIAKEDHYILVLLAVAGGSLPVVEQKGSMAREITWRLALGIVLGLLAMGTVLEIANLMHSH